jgi:hypothetical protein
LNVFEILHDDIECFPYRNHQNECICYFRVRLIESDEAHERRLNREAKESYHMRVIISSSSDNDNDNDNDNNAFAYIRVNVLDDNDLEPMFDQSEFVFELNEDSHYLPAFTHIGRVTATDPDLDLNSHVRYFINCNEHNSCHKFFGIQWRTGDVYLKQSSHELFAFNSINEFNFEINAIDAGLKTNLVKTLLSLTNQTLLANDAEAEASSWEDKLLKLTATHPNISKTLPSSSSSSFRVETAQVKIKLKRVNTLSKTNIDLIKFDTASHDLLEQVFFRLNADPSRMPLAILQTNSSTSFSHSQQLIRHHLRLLKLYTRNSLTQNYLIYSSDTTLSNVDIDLSFLLLSLTSKPIRAQVSILDDVISRLCQIEMSVIESSTQLVFRVDSILGTILGGDGENFCQNLLIYQYYNLFHYEYQLENDDDGHHNLSSSSFITHNLITIRPSNSFKSLRLRASLIFNKTRVVLSTSKVFKFDSIKTNLMSGQFRLPTRKHLTLKWSSTRQKLDDTILNNASMIIASEPRGVFNLDNGYLMSQVANSYGSTNLLIRVNSSLDYLSVHVRANQEFEEKNCFINVKLTNSVNQTSRQFKVGIFLFFFQVTQKIFLQNRKS